MHGAAARLSQGGEVRRASTGGSRLWLENKRRRHPPHLQARLLGGFLSTRRRRRRARVRASGGTRKQEAAARVAQVRASKGRRVAINSPGGLPWCAGHAQGRAQLGLGGGGGGVRVGDGEAEGMTGGALGSATAREGGRSG
jgi:hypothetical protein